jgi:hypothetical protein
VFVTLNKETKMKIKIVSKGSQKTKSLCPWVVDFPPEATE